MKNIKRRTSTATTVSIFESCPKYFASTQRQARLMGGGSGWAARDQADQIKVEGICRALWCLRREETDWQTSRRRTRLGAAGPLLRWGRKGPRSFGVAARSKAGAWSPAGASCGVELVGWKAPSMGLKRRRAEDFFQKRREKYKHIRKS